MNKLRRESLLFVSLIIVLLISSCGKSSNTIDESNSLSNNATQGSTAVATDKVTVQHNPIQLRRKPLRYLHQRHILSFSQMAVK